MIEVKAVFEELSRDRLSHFKATIGDTILEPIPIGFLRIGELKNLQMMLELAYDEGKENSLK